MTKRTFAEFRGAYKAPRLTATVTTRADLLAKVTELTAEYESLQPSDAMNGRRAQIPRELESLAAEIRDSEFTFEFQAISKAEYDRLAAMYPPLPSQREDGYAWNLEEFPPALIAECSVEPVLSLDEAREMADMLTDSQFKKLWHAAIAVNVGPDDAPKFVTPYEPEGSDEMSSDTPLNTESPDPSYSDD